jgi:hypothetical protein
MANVHAPLVRMTVLIIAVTANTNPTPSSIRAIELGSGAVTAWVRAPETRFHPQPPHMAGSLPVKTVGTGVLVVRGPPVYPTKDPRVGVEISKLRKVKCVSEMLSTVKTLKVDIEGFVKGPTLGDSPFIVTSAEMIAPVVLLITMSPPSVQPETEHDALPVGDRLPDTSSVTISARAAGAAMTTNSTARIIHNDFRIFSILPAAS